MPAWAHPKFTSLVRKPPAALRSAISRMPVDSLREMSTRACAKISKRITDIGALPYEVARPFLLKIENPEQLRQIEENCQQIIGLDAEIWLQLIKRDVPNWENKRHEPKNPRNWYKVYNKLKKESLEEMDAGADKLKAALEGIKAEKEQTLAQVVTHKKLPKSGIPSWQQRAAYNYVSGRTGSKGASKMSLLEKIKKEARDGRNARMAVPTHELRKSSVAVPPRQFVEDLTPQPSQQHKQQRNEIGGSPERLIKTSHSLIGMHNATQLRPQQSSTTQQDFQDREARLRALTSGKIVPVRKELRGFDVVIEETKEPTPDARRMPINEAGLMQESKARRTLPLGIDDQKSPARIANPPSGMIRKRKEAPNLFMAREPKRQIRDFGDSIVR